MSSRSQTITTLALVVAASTLGGYLWFVDRGKPTSTELEARKNNLLPAFQRDQLSEIVVELGSERATLTRSGSDSGESDYRLSTTGTAEAFNDAPADQAAVDRLVQSLEFASPLRKIEDGPTASMGLDHPRAVLSLRMGRLSWKLTLGAAATSPTGAAYAKVADQGVYVVGRDFASDLLRPIDSYRSRNVLPYVASDMSSIRLEGAGGARSLVRAPWGGFKLEHGPRVDRVAFDRLLNAFASLRAERFVGHDAAAQAIATARGASGAVSLVIEPTDKARPVVRLEAGGTCPGPAPDAGSSDAGSSDVPEQGKLVAVVRTEPGAMAACVPADVMEAFKMPQDTLVDHHLFDLKPDEVEELKIQRGERVLELLRKGSGWKLRSPEEREVPSSDAQGLTRALSRLEAEVVATPDLKALGLEPPSGTVVITQPASGHQQHAQQKLELGSNQGEFSYVRRSADGVVLRIPRAQATVLEPDGIALRAVQLLDVPAERLRKVSATWGTDEKQTVVRSPSGFKLETPPGYVADGAMSADLFDAVAKLTAERWAAERDDGSFGLGQPRVTASFEVADDGGVKVWRLLIGARADDASFARWEPDTGVFLVPRSVENTLTSYVIDRSAFIIDPAEVRTMSLSTGVRTEALTASAGKLRADPDAGATLGETAVARIQDAFLQMRAEGVVHVGEARPDEGLDKPLLEVRVKRVPGHEERSKDIRIVIGKGDVWRTVNVYYARRDGIAATYAIAASRVKPVLSAMGID